MNNFVKTQMSQPASPDSLFSALCKVLPDGNLQRIPRHPERRDIVLAVVCLGLRRRQPYSEPQLNDLLADAIASFNGAVDHVTCRRYLVDLGFVKRDRAGTRYFVNYPKLEMTLAPESIEQAPALLTDAIAAGCARAVRPRPVEHPVS